MEYQCAKKFYVGYSDVDSNDKCRLSKILDYLQNVATIHSESLGYGTKAMMDLKQAWLVTSMKVRIFKYPVADKEIECRTWSRGLKGVTAKRDYEVFSEDGEKLFIGSSNWALFDLENQKLMRVPEEMQNAYSKLDKEVFEGEETGKAKDNDVIETEKVFEIGKRDIDTNHHLNNARYFDLISEVLPDDLKVKGFECFYKKQIMYKEIVYISYGEGCARIKNEAGETCFYVVFERG